MPSQERLETVAQDQFIDNFAAYQTAQGVTIVLSYPAVSIVQ
jgi:hypothetical protein